MTSPTSSPTSPSVFPTPSASSDDGLEELLDTLQVVGQVDLLTLTDEELACIGADEGSIVRRLQQSRLDGLPEETRTAVLATALRSLVARGLIRQPGQRELENANQQGRLDLEPLGDLDLVLAVRRSPASVVLAVRETAVAFLYGLRPAQGPAILEERVVPDGLHFFRLLSLDDAVAALAELADPEGRTRPDGRELGPTRPDVLHELVSVPGELDGLTRLEAYHNREAGNRRIQVTVARREDRTYVATGAFGVDPRPLLAFEVSAAGLRRCLRMALADGDCPVEEIQAAPDPRD